MKFYEFKGRKIQCSFSFDEREFQSEFQKTKQKKPHACVKKNNLKKKRKKREKHIFYLFIIFLDVFFGKKWKKKKDFFGNFPWLNRVGGGSEPPSPNLRAARPESPDPPPLGQRHFSRKKEFSGGRGGTLPEKNLWCKNFSEMPIFFSGPPARK